MTEEYLQVSAEEYKKAGMKGLPYKTPIYRGFNVLEVLPQLKGKPWNDEAVYLVHSLRPSSVVVTTGLMYADARTWRVTVIVDKFGVIEKIQQECEVGISPGSFKPPREAGMFYAPYILRDLT